MLLHSHKDNGKELIHGLQHEKEARRGDLCFNEGGLCRANSSGLVTFSRPSSFVEQSKTYSVLWLVLAVSVHLLLGQAVGFAPPKAMPPQGDQLTPEHQRLP